MQLQALLNHLNVFLKYDSRKLKFWTNRMGDVFQFRVNSSEILMNPIIDIFKTDTYKRHVQRIT